MKKNKIVNLLLAGAMVLGMAGSSGFAVYAEDDPVENPTGNVDGNTEPSGNEGQSNNENGTPNVTFRNSGPVLGNTGNGTTYTITYDAGNHGSNAPESQVKNAGEDIVLSDQKPSGKAISGYTEVHVADDYDEIDTTDLAYVESTQWTFDHWVSGEGDDAVEYAPGDTYTVDADLALTAVYTSVSSTTKPTLPTATKAGYTLDGWYTEENGQGDFCGNAGEEIVDLLIRPTVIYPKWVEEGGSVPTIDETTFTTGSAFNEALNRILANKYQAEGEKPAALEGIAFHRTDYAPALGIYTEDVSAAQDGTILMFVEDGDVVWYSPAETVYMNEDASHMFQTGTKLIGYDIYPVVYVRAFTSIDLSGIDSSNTTDMSYMFWGGVAYDGAIIVDSIKTTIDLSALNTSNVTNMEGTFFDFSAETLDASSLDTANVTNMYWMFRGMQNLTSINLAGFNTANVTDMSGMFDGDIKLTSLDVSMFNTSNVTNMYYMFQKCQSLTQLDLRNFDTRNVTSMAQMFQDCSGLTSLNVTSFSTNPEGNYSAMFKGCSSIEAIDVSSLDFHGKLAFDGSYTGEFYAVSMFEGMTALKELNLENWKTVQCNRTMADRMFANCPNLKTIWVTRNWKPLTDRHQNMFEGDLALTGIKGTVFTPDHLNGDYAHIDEGTTNPGYLSMNTFTIHYVNELKPESVPADQIKDPGVDINISDFVPEGKTTVTRTDVSIYPDYDTISKSGIYFIKTVKDEFSEWVDPYTGYRFKPGDKCDADMNLTLKAGYSQSESADGIMLPYAEKDGYRLMGWYTEANGQGEFIGFAGARWDYTENVPDMIYPYWVSESQATTIKVETYLDDELYTGDDFVFEIRNQATNELLGVISHFENGIGETGIVVSNFEDTTVVIKQVSGDNEMMNYDMNSFTKVIEKKA